MRVMFDTNAFNDLIKGSYALVKKNSNQYFCTNLQKAEIQRTANTELRELLINGFQVIQTRAEIEQLPQHSTPWSSPWGSPWDRDGEHYDQILAELEKKKRKDRGNSYDAVIIETCIYEQLVFVSGDRAAREVAQQFGVNAMTLETFLKL